MKKKLASHEEMRKANWKRRILLEKEYTQTCAEWVAERLEALINHLQYGHAVIAYRKQDGCFCLATATLLYYEKDFRRKYDADRIQNTVVYWNTEQQAWRTFRIENFLEWKPVV